jgi:hypothetical protein
MNSKEQVSDGKTAKSEMPQKPRSVCSPKHCILENSANPPQIDRNVHPSRSDEKMKEEKSVQLQMATKRIELSRIPQAVQQ